MSRKTLSPLCFVATGWSAVGAIHTLDQRAGFPSLGVAYRGGNDAGRTDNSAQEGTIARR